MVMRFMLNLVIKTILLSFEGKGEWDVHVSCAWMVIISHTGYWGECSKQWRL